MNKKDKNICKDMMRQAMEDYNTYNKLNIAGYSEKKLLVEGMVAVLDYLPVDMYRRIEMTLYVFSIMSRILGI